MKDNLNIERLFREKFNSFEGEVDPGAWANIQQGMNMNAGAVAAKTGMSLFIKTAIVSGGIIAATVAGVYLFSDEKPAENNENNVTLNDNSALNHKGENGESNGNYAELNLAGIKAEENNNSVITDENSADNVNQENSAVINQETEDNNTTATDGNNEGAATMLSETENQTSNGDNNNGSTAENESGTANNGHNTTVEYLTENQQVNDEGNTTGHEKELLPTGNLTFEAGDSFAPSRYSFHSNAGYYSSVRWDFGDGHSDEGTDVVHTFEKPGTYDVKMTVVGKTEDFTTTERIVIQAKSSIENIPNIITPNGDHINDFFVVNSKEIETFFITISDANGHTVFESDDCNFRWYGTDQNGNVMEKGRYTYQIFAKGTDGKEFKIPGQLYLK